MRSINKGYFFASIVVTLVIWFNSFMPADISGAQSGFIVSIINNIFLVVNIELDLDILSIVVRKLAHFTLFFILGLLWFNTFDIPKRLVSLSLLISIVICYMTAIIDESIQLTSAGRGFSLLDILIDQLGATLAIIIASKWSLYKRKRKSLKSS